MSVTPLTIDEEFRSLIPPLSHEAYEALEDDIFNNGCKTPIVVWQNKVIDNFFHYEICQKWEIPYTVSERDFSIRAEVISWICKKQLQDLTHPEETRRFLLGKYYEMEKEIFMYEETQAGNSSHIHSCQYKIASQIGKEYHMSTSTVYKYGIYTRAIEDIAHKEPTIAAKILSGKLKVSHNNIIELSRLPKDQLHNLNSHLSERDIERISYSEMRHELQWKRLPSLPQAAKAEPQTDIPIKQTPKYDPDAELASLMLTIPSWISSIKRTLNNTNLPLVSETAKQKLKVKLHELRFVIDSALRAIEEDD